MTAGASTIRKNNLIFLKPKLKIRTEKILNVLQYATIQCAQSAINLESKLKSSCVISKTELVKMATPSTSRNTYPLDAPCIQKCYTMLKKSLPMSKLPEKERKLAQVLIINSKALGKYARESMSLSSLAIANSSNQDCKDIIQTNMKRDDNSNQKQNHNSRRIQSARPSKKASKKQGIVTKISLQLCSENTHTPIKKGVEVKAVFLVPKKLPNSKIKEEFSMLEIDTKAHADNTKYPILHSTTCSMTII